MRSRHKLYFRGGFWPSAGAAIKFKPYNKRIPVTDVTEQTSVWFDLNLLSVFVPLPFDVWRRRDQRAVGVAASAARIPNVDDPETTLPPGVVGTVGTRGRHAHARPNIADRIRSFGTFGKLVL